MSVSTRLPFVLAAILLACQSEDVSLGEPEGTDGQTGSASTMTSSPSSSSAGSMSASSTSSDPDSSTADPTSAGTMASDSTDGETTSLSGSSSETSGPPTGNTVIYVNFDGVTLEEGDDDARADTTSIGALAGDLQPFGGGAQPAEIIDELEVVWADFDVAITDARPGDGDYTMVVVTPTNPFPGSLGIAPIDCDNGNPNNIAFVFSSAAAGHESALIARMISREVAHTYGLDDVASADDIMNEASIEIDATFTDTCAPLGSGAACPGQHAEQCPGGGQNSAAELTALTGG